MLLRVCKFQLAYLIIAYLKKRVKRICCIKKRAELLKIQFRPARADEAGLFYVRLPDEEKLWQAGDPAVPFDES